MKLKKSRLLWRDAAGVRHLLQPTGDDHTACGVPLDQDYYGKPMESCVSDEVTCSECSNVIKLYKEL